MRRRFSLNRRPGQGVPKLENVQPVQHGLRKRAVEGDSWYRLNRKDALNASSQARGTIRMIETGVSVPKLAGVRPVRLGRGPPAALCFLRVCPAMAMTRRHISATIEPVARF